jgi:hypothetical protein
MNKMIVALSVIMNAHILNAAAPAVAVPTAPMPAFDPNAQLAQQPAAQAAAPAQAAQPQQAEAPEVFEKSDRVIGLTEDGKKVYALKKNGKGHAGKHHKGKHNKGKHNKGQGKKGHQKEAP